MLVCDQKSSWAMVKICLIRHLFPSALFFSPSTSKLIFLGLRPLSSQSCILPHWQRNIFKSSGISHALNYDFSTLIIHNHFHQKKKKVLISEPQTRLRLSPLEIQHNQWYFQDILCSTGVSNLLLFFGKSQFCLVIAWIWSLLKILHIFCSSFTINSTIFFSYSALLHS